VCVIITLKRIKITIVPVEITVMSVIISFVRVKITLRAETTLCVSTAGIKHTRTCRNHTREYHNHTREYHNDIQTCTNHSVLKSQS
jgi:capsular polysaccharide biosynthesis protein